MAIRKTECGNCGANVGPSIFANDPWCSDICRKAIQGRERNALEVIDYTEPFPVVDPRKAGVVRTLSSPATKAFVQWLLYYELNFMSFRVKGFRYFVYAPRLRDVVRAGSVAQEVLGGTPSD